MGLSARGGLRRSHLQRRQAFRPPRRAADEVRVRHQPQDRQSPRPDDSAVAARAGRSGNRVMDRRMFLAGTGALLFAAPLVAWAQPERSEPRIARVFANTPEAEITGPNPTSP